VINWDIGYCVLSVVGRGEARVWCCTRGRKAFVSICVGGIILIAGSIGGIGSGMFGSGGDEACLTISCISGAQTL